MPSLYKRAGGASTMRRIVDRLHADLVADPALAPWFADIDMQRLADRHARFLAWVTGGPAAFSDAEIRAAHADLNLTPAAFRKVSQQFRAALSAHLPAEADVEHVMRAIQRREPLVVQADDHPGPD